MSVNEDLRFKLRPLYSSYSKADCTPILQNSDSKYSISVSKGTKRKRTSELTQRTFKQSYSKTISDIQKESTSNQRFQTFLDISKENFGFSNSRSPVYYPQQMTDQVDDCFSYNDAGVTCSEIKTCMSTVTHTATSSYETTDSGAREVKRAKRVERNRQSAAASRERKKRYLEQLERRVSVLSADNVRLQMELWKQLAVKHENQVLIEENNRLREELHFHQTLLGLKEREGMISTTLSFDFN
ncbi:hypothetical protein GpartN1_g3326.t1 [Galdieria partita]|uniref:BZIP domain-containing protein n=1 Tax=Galdieria partita TaxID=83374 RepID=A0A9C7PW96_9RHOD|nr:hypothetical protein GpartN1_g3326.t1 [Galdieria partita]